jgi:AraC-like DNA-binding protein
MSVRPYINSFVFDDFDHFTEFVRQGDIEHHQLSSGEFSGSLKQIVSRSLILGLHRMNQFILQEGTAIKGYVTFLIPGDMSQDFTWRCNQLKGNVIGVIREGMEHRSVTHPNFLGMPVSVQTTYLRKVADELGYFDFFKRIVEQECFEVDTNEAIAVRSEIRRVFRNPKVLDPAWEEDLVIRLIHLLYRKERTGFERGRVSRRKIYHKAVRFMFDHVLEPISILEVSKGIGVSERNLRYAFHEVAGISPKRFFDRIRLNQVRKLLRSGNFQSVIEVSQTYGYWHSGKFASDYQSLFYEFPSESLILSSSKTN